MSDEKVQEEPRAATGTAEVSDVIAEYQSAKRYRAWVLRLVVIAILVVVGIGIYRYYAYFRDLVNDLLSPKTAELASKRLSATIIPKIENQGKALFERLKPRVTEMAKQKAAQVRPRLTQVLQREGNIFQVNFKRSLDEKARDLVKQMIEEHKAELKGEFPELDDPAKMENLVRLLTEATRDAAVKVFLDKRLNEHLEVLEAMQDKVQMLPVRDPSETNRELVNRLGEVAWQLFILKTSPGSEAETTPVTPASSQ